MNAPVLLLAARLPPGSSSDDVHRLAAEVMRPAFAALDEAPAVRAGIVLSGEALKALESEASDVLDQLRERVGDGRLEAVATALYEPIFGDVPEEDAVGQVHAHLALVRRLLDVRPRGLALPWLAWSSVAARVAQRCELDWVTLPGATGVVSLEHEGATARGLGIVAVGVGEAVDGAVHIDLHALGWHGADPGARTWFRSLLAGLASTALPSEAVDAGLPAPRRVVLGKRPGAMYRRRWPASDLLHQRVMATSQLVARLAREAEAADAHGIDPVSLVQAQRYLWRAEAGDVFLDGDEGGIRAPSQRHRAWRDVLRAERLALEGVRAARRPGATPVDLDGDGVPEILLRSPEASARIVPAHRGAVASFSIGGAALQLGALPRRTRDEWEAELRPGPADAPDPGASGEYAAQDILAEARRRQDLHAALREDLDPRLGFADRFLHGEASLERFESGDLSPTTTGLDVPWTVESAERSGGVARTSLLARGEYHDGDESWPIEVRKRYALRGSELELRYEVQNQGLGVLRTRVLLPFDVSLGADGGAQQVVLRGKRYPLDSTGDEPDLDLVRVLGPAGELTLRSDTGMRVWRYPVHTVHRRRGVLDHSLQGVCLGVVWLLQLWARESAALTLRVGFEPT